MALGDSFTGIFDGLIATSTNSAVTALSANALQQNMVNAQNLYGNYVYTYTPQPGFGALGSISGAIVSPPEHRPKKEKCCGRGEAEEHASNCWRVTDVCDCHAGRASKHHSMVWRLRKEIDSWHGNVLERCPA